MWAILGQIISNIITTLLKEVLFTNKELTTKVNTVSYAKAPLSEIPGSRAQGIIDRYANKQV